jgi:hypothetical protein
MLKESALEVKTDKTKRMYLGLQITEGGTEHAPSS